MNGAIGLGEARHGAGSVVVGGCGDAGCRPALSASEVERVFEDCFTASHRVRLEGGADEPLYLPPEPSADGRICYRADYVASALHEVAHWCIAGRARREHVDYGYWYAPAGRDEDAQARFEAVEARPQALEQIFAEAAGVRFVPSVDNPGGDASALTRLAERIADARVGFQAQGLPPRAARFRAALARARSA